MRAKPDYIIMSVSRPCIEALTNCMASYTTQPSTAVVFVMLGYVIFGCLQSRTDASQDIDWCLAVPSISVVFMGWRPADCILLFSTTRLERCDFRNLSLCWYNNIMFSDICKKICAKLFYCNLIVYIHTLAFLFFIVCVIIKSHVSWITINHSNVLDAGASHC